MRVPLIFLQFAILSMLLDRRRVEGSTRSADRAYDSNKGVFSPQGRLVQLDYVEGLVKRGNLCMAAECKDGVVLMSNKLVSADAAKLLVDGGVRRIYRVDSHIGILPAGLPADGRALAHKAMDYCRSHRREYGEPIPGRLLAERLGEFIHAACVRWGSRAYPNALFVACWEEGLSYAGPGAVRLGCESRDGRGDAGIADASRGGSTPKQTATVEATSGVNMEEEGNKGEEEEGEEGKGEEGKGEEGEGEQTTEAEADRDAGFQLYVVDPSGAVRRHKAACEGRGSSHAREWLHRRASAPGAPEDSSSSSSVLSSGDEDGTASDPEEEEKKIGQSVPVGWLSEHLGAPEEGIEEGVDEGGRRRRKRRRRPMFSQMTCVEAARAMVGEARRMRAGEPGAGGEGSEDVASLPEVAWLSIDRGKGRGGGGGGKPVFVHHRSVETLFKSEG